MHKTWVLTSTELMLNWTGDPPKLYWEKEHENDYFGNENITIYLICESTDRCLGRKMTINFGFDFIAFSMLSICFIAESYL